MLHATSLAVRVIIDRSTTSGDVLTVIVTLSKQTEHEARGYWKCSSIDKGLFNQELIDQPLSKAY